jgi:hypothetical protein
MEELVHMVLHQVLAVEELAVRELVKMLLDQPQETLQPIMVELEQLARHLVIMEN